MHLQLTINYAHIFFSAPRGGAPAPLQPRATPMQSKRLQQGMNNMTYAYFYRAAIPQCQNLDDRWQYKSNQIKSNGLLGVAALMLDHNNIEVMC